ncbi:MAG: PSD1 and planctomycete cytochrome C domain-containing protein [Isosphaeraceae bacterium]|nr:PSD1 and planctomycete cytochrome C domain-containing protein [Isosphaeraceae bacterium]
MQPQLIPPTCRCNRSPRLRRTGCVVLVLALAGLGRPVAAAEPVDFSRDVLPILSDKCFLCHGPDAKTRKADLRLDLKDEALRAKDAVIAPGRSAESEVFLRVTTNEPDEQMPPPKSGRTLTGGQVETLKRWIDGGAKWGKHWAFERPERPGLPPVRDKRWSANPIDRFVLARLQSEGLNPSPEADRTTLIRRLTLDLTGLPPTLSDIDAFVADKAPDAYDRLVDRLLASPHYGERMVWEWLDAARYADSNGYQGDGERTMWPWRDWAIAALNRNMPFDEFTVWQLAGDLLPGATSEQKLATGFCRNHMINGEGGRIAEENRVDYVMDMAETTGTVWLGLTFNCCRCHDHKFDPLTQRDYYSLFAFFNQTPVNGGGGDPQTPPVIPYVTNAQSATLSRWNHAVDAAAKAVDASERQLFPRSEGKPATDAPRAAGVPAEVASALKAEPGSRNSKQVGQLEKHWQSSEPAYSALLKTLREAIDARDGFNRGLPRVMVMEDLAQARPTFILDRGSYEKPGAKVEAAVPASLPPLPAGSPRTRLALARWLVSPENPLTARVTVNRVWQQFFGAGLVKTPEDFGVQGQNPSHPELLDWLATELVRSGWDMKALHRSIVTSATYRQASRATPALVERDPQNRLLARGPRFRLPSWMIRDQALAASGLLSPRIGGTPVNPYQPAGVWEEATFGNKHYQQDRGEGLYRRSVYTFWRRIVGPTEFFDSAPRQTCVVKPTRTNSPLHALTTLNDITYVEAGRALGERVLKSAGPADADRLELAYRLVVARKPSREELRVLLASVARVRREFASDSEAARKLLSVGESPRDGSLDLTEHATYAAVCGALFNLDEACTKE